MKLDVTIENGDIKIDVDSLLESLTPEQARHLANQEAFRDRVVWGVAQLLSEGEFDDDDDDYYWKHRDFVSLVARRYDAMLPATMRNIVRELHDQAEESKRRADAYRNAMWKLQEAWRDAKRPADVDVGDYRLRHNERMTEEQAAEFIRGVEATQDPRAHDESHQ